MISAKALLDSQAKRLWWWSFWGWANVPPKHIWITSKSLQSCDWLQVCNSSDNKHQICSFLLRAIFKFALGNIPCRTKKRRAWACYWQPPSWLHFKSMVPIHRWQSYLSIPFKHKTSKANLTPNLSKDTFAKGILITKAYFKRDLNSSRSITNRFSVT